MKLLLAAVLLFAGNTAFSQSLRKVAEFDLKNSGGTDNVGWPVFALRFSPDSGKIAVIAGLNYDDQTRSEVSNLLVFDIVGSQVAYQAATPYSVDETEHDWPSNFQWSPDGKSIYAGERLHSLIRRETCDLMGWGGFIGNDRFVARQPSGFGPDGKLSRETPFVFFDTACKQVERWIAPGDWSFLDTSPESGFMLIQSQSTDSKSRETLLLKTEDKTVVARWPRTQVWASRFADHGRAMCGVRDSSDADKVPVLCWATATGQPIAEAPTVSGGKPFSVATQATRAVVSDYRRSRIPFSREYREVLKHRVVWDFGTGKELAAWYPDKQEYRISGGKPFSSLFRFTISPDGRFLAEGGSGVVRIFRIGE